MSAADIIASHQYKPDGQLLGTRCTHIECDWFVPASTPFTDMLTSYGEHVVEALSRADLVLVGQDMLNRASGDLLTGSQIVGNHAEMLAQLKMDTPEDQATTDRLVELCRQSAQVLTNAATRVVMAGAS
ncbi:hypothetical protein GS982_19990 [Rhodococcus hoagii]|nr:hypothetical protein [Prescottella equi]NKZ84484.1 hypothetical protein [Prescottella equi]